MNTDDRERTINTLVDELSSLEAQRNTALARAEKAETALRKITRPKGVYRINKEKYLANIIDWCIATAEEALDATTPEPTEKE